jgi:hypothetical protein
VTRQLNIKTNESKSWFTILKKTLIKYDFSNINELVEKPLIFIPTVIAAFDGFKSLEMSRIG